MSERETSNDQYEKACKPHRHDDRRLNRLQMEIVNEVVNEKGMTVDEGATSFDGFAREREKRRIFSSSFFPLSTTTDEHRTSKLGEASRANGIQTLRRCISRSPFGETTAKARVIVLFSAGDYR